MAKICNIDKKYWDDKITTILGEYITSYKRSISKEPFKMVYGQEAVVPLHFKQQTLEIAQILRLDIEKLSRKDCFNFKG